MVCIRWVGTNGLIIQPEVGPLRPGTGPQEEATNHGFYQVDLQRWADDSARGGTPQTWN